MKKKYLVEPDGRLAGFLVNDEGGCVLGPHGPQFRDVVGHDAVVIFPRHSLARADHLDPLWHQHNNILADRSSRTDSKRLGGRGVERRDRAELVGLDVRERENRRER